jgi:hypothetical protein
LALVDLVVSCSDELIPPCSLPIDNWPLERWIDLILMSSVVIPSSLMSLAAITHRCPTLTACSEPNNLD